MDVSNSKFDYKRSRERIDRILDNQNISFIEDEDKFPSELLVTFDRGQKKLVDVLVIDIRDSTTLSELMSISDSDKKRITILKKVYGVYISEVIAILRDNENIEKVYIEGDGIWAVFEPNENQNTHLVFGTAIKVSTIVETINSKLRDRGYPYIKVGIGIETGATYYIKGGLKGSAINEEVWIGNIVNKAFKFCSYANKKPLNEIVISPRVYEVLRPDQQKVLKYYRKKNIYHGSIYDKKMYDEWLKYNPDPQVYSSCKDKKYCYYKLDEKESIKLRIWLGILLLTALLIGIGFFLFS